MRAACVTPFVFPASCNPILRRLVMLAAFLAGAVVMSHAFAADTDCIEDGGLRLCSAPTLSPYVYGACVNSNFPSTINASAYCYTQVPTPWATEAEVLAYAACMPVRESSACTASAALSGWQPPGTSTSLGLCGTQNVVVTNGAETRGHSLITYSVTYPDPGGGSCQPGGYTTTVATRNRTWVCPENTYQQTRPNGQTTCARHPADQGTDCSECDGKLNITNGASFGNPIQIGTREKIQVERDYEGPILKFVRTYRGQSSFVPTNGQPYILTGLGKKWFHTYDRRIFPYPGNAYVMASALRPNGDVRYFKLNGREKIYLGPSALLEAISAGGAITGWRLTSTDSEVEEYDAAGQLLTITRNGSVQTLTYSDGSTAPSIAPFPGLLIQVTDHTGRSLGFRYDSAGRLIKMIDPGTNEYLYAYDEASAERKTGELPSSDLTSVVYPQTGVAISKRIYHYNEPARYNPPVKISGTTIYTRALTGITDELGNRIASYAYSLDDRARAYQSYGAMTTNLFQLSQSGSVGNIVSNSLGAWKTFSFSNPIDGVSASLAGATRVRGVIQPCASGVSGCSAVEMVNPAADGYPINRVSFNQWRTTYTWDKNRGLETQRVEGLNAASAPTPATRTISTQWHATFALPTLITESGRTTAFTYNADGNVLTKTVTDTVSSATRVWTYTYNGFGQILTIDGPRTDLPDVTTYGYDGSGNLLSITNPLSQVTSITSHDAHGRPLTVVDPNGLTTTLAYNVRGWITSSTTGSEVTTYDYDNIGQATKITFPDASYREYVFDAAKRLTEIRDNTGDKIVYTYDQMSNRTKDEVFDGSSTLVQSRTRTFNSLLRQTQDVGGTTPLAQVTQYGYDNNGNVTTVTAPLSRVTTNTYDQLDRLTQITAPGSNITKFAYNARDQLTSVTDPRNNVTTYTVNALDDLTQQVSPDTGTTVNTHDAAGNVLTSRDAKLQTTTSTYDALNRITQATHHDSSKVEYGYDAGTNGVGRLTSLTEKDPAGTVVTTTSYTYDAHGRLLTDTRAIGGVNYVTTYGYDSSGRLNSLTYPSGLALAYTLDAVGKITQITATPAGGGAATVLSGATYHPFGDPKSWTFGNSQAYSRTFDLDGRISGFTLDGTAMTVTFDAAGRITGQTYFPTPASSVTYGYDTLDRLTSTITPITTYGFGYDANGNRTTKTVGAGTKTYAYPGTNNKLSSITGGGTWTYAHDANGSVTSDNTNTFSYDTRGRMIGATTGLGTLTYALNALGQRYSKTLSGTTTAYLYDAAGRLLAESSDGGATYTEYLWLQDTPVALIKPGSASLYYIHTDHLDTPRLIANQTPATVWRWDNDDPVGANMADANPSGLGVFTFNPRLPGQYFDTETNNHYNYFRDYSSEIGRYIQSDPIGLLVGTNTYSYALSSPIYWSDPMGLEVLLCRRPTNFQIFGKSVSIGQHFWLKTDSKEGGMGGTDGNVPAQGNSDLPGDPVQVNDHQGQSTKANSSCAPVSDVDEGCVNRMLAPGRPLGKWGINNQCQSFTLQVLSECKRKSK